MKIGEVIVSLRKQKGVEQQELAKALGKSVPYLSLIENNKKRPSISLLADIAEYFDIPVTTLVFQAIDTAALKDKKQKAYFKAAKPVVEILLNYLLSEESTHKKKLPLAPKKLRHKPKGRFN